VTFFARGYWSSLRQQELTSESLRVGETLGSDPGACRRRADYLWARCPVGSRRDPRILLVLAPFCGDAVGPTSRCPVDRTSGGIWAAFASLVAMGARL